MLTQQRAEVKTKMEKSAVEQSGKERVEGLTAEEGKEMEILKDLPSYNSSNFSKVFSQGASSNASSIGKNNSVRKLCGLM